MDKNSHQAPESSPETIHQWLADSQAILVDVRETAEYEQEHIPGSMLVPLSCFEPDLFPRFKVKKLVLHCAVGKRSAAAAKQLSMSGYPQTIVNMAGGIRAWKEAGLPTECLNEVADEPLQITVAHPGTILAADFLTPFNITQKKLASDLAISLRRVNELILGKRSLTADTALRLARYFSTTSEFWMRLQMEHDVDVARARLKLLIADEVQPRRLGLSSPKRIN